ncbi:heme-binding protein [Streptomyces sp. JV185]|uniref:heme-binding protein n=1 Tax=Streptomyces sp. JV185 TaxID=858638 RepID=UPI002E771BFB|nr:heme-binding protein [Streptomyces sp. JV185]MEE1768485.1 heme-binding protein [Streptomyces sp. JV185]
MPTRTSSRPPDRRVPGESAETAPRERASASSDRPTRPSSVEGRERSPHIPAALFLAGGAPVRVNGAPIAAIGVAGAPSGGLDEKFARAGVASLGR